MAQKRLRLTPPRVVRLVIIFAIIVAVIAVIGYYAGYYKASTGQHNQADLRATATSETTKRKDLAPAGTGSVKPVSDPAQLDAFIVGPGGDIKSEADVLNVHRRNAKDPSRWERLMRQSSFPSFPILNARFVPYTSMVRENRFYRNMWIKDWCG